MTRKYIIFFVFMIFMYPAFFMLLDFTITTIFGLCPSTVLAIKIDSFLACVYAIPFAILFLLPKTAIYFLIISILAFLALKIKALSIRKLLYPFFIIIAALSLIFKYKFDNLTGYRIGEMAILAVFTTEIANAIFYGNLKLGGPRQEPSTRSAFLGRFLLKFFLLAALAFIFNLISSVFNLDELDLCANLFISIFLAALFLMSLTIGYTAVKKSSDFSYGIISAYFIFLFWICFFGGFDLSYHLSGNKLYLLFPFLGIVLPYTGFCAGCIIGKRSKMKDKTRVNEEETI